MFRRSFFRIYLGEDYVMRLLEEDVIAYIWCIVLPRKEPILIWNGPKHEKFILYLCVFSSRILSSGFEMARS